jgi:hypothetical protein
VSNPVTSWSFVANNAAADSPTYPRPCTQTLTDQHLSAIEFASLAQPAASRQRSIPRTFA